MTSRIEAIKTNEFIRRRKLRLQQVREQSKDIAKKVRQRTQVDKLRNIINEEAEKDFLQCQNQVLHKLQHMYAQHTDNVGVGHKKADEINQQEKDQVKAQLLVSKQRARDAALELKKLKQERLDEQKKILNRKLLAREIANEISRDKSSSVGNKFLKVSQNCKAQSDDKNDGKKNAAEAHSEEKSKKIKTLVNTNDMATQYEAESVLEEWPNIPALKLADDTDALKASDNLNVRKSDQQSNQVNLFAVSAEMPSCLRGGLASIPEHLPEKQPVTIVSDYLQNRVHRFREINKKFFKSKTPEDLKSIKETILRSRSSKIQDLNDVPSEDRGEGMRELRPPQRASVTVYNHTTRDSRDIPRDGKPIVSRESLEQDNAYSQAMKEVTVNLKSKDKETRLEKRNKIAISKQNVEKEYQDTMSFLNSISKNKHLRDRPITQAFLNDEGQKNVKQLHQRKMQEEFNKIGHESVITHNCRKSRTANSSPDLPMNFETEGFEKNVQYTWMPVPDADENMAVHTVTSVKSNKNGNSVKFSNLDGCHEYRSRHKHTPPTKDRSENIKTNAVNIENKDENSGTASDVSASSSVEDLSSASKKYTEHSEKKKSDAERIIVYKILNKQNKSRRNTKNNSNLNYKDSQTSPFVNRNNLNVESNDQSEFTFSQNHLKEGIYKAVRTEGDNITSIYYSKDQCFEDNEQGSSCNGTSATDVKKDQQKSIIQSGEHASLMRPTSSSEVVNDNYDTTTLDKQTHAKSSNSSFKSINGKKDPADTAAEKEYMKLVSEETQETAKFYIGATGFLKNEAYEVVIQLRKKDDNKEGLEATNLSNTNENLKNLNPNKLATVENTTGEKDHSTKVGYSEDSSHKVPLTNENKAMSASDICNAAQIDATNKGLIRDHNDEPKNQPCTKAIETDKNDILYRNATSTYTQTSLNSPIHRPMLLHMSSSTSTAYMSPPEMVLPKYLKPEVDSVHGSKTHNDFDCGRDSSILKCKRCLHAKKVIRDRLDFKKMRENAMKLKTPPNTSTSINSDMQHEILTTDKTNKDQCKSFRGNNKKRYHGQKSKLLGKSDMNAFSMPKKKIASKKVQKLSVIDPIVKKYVNKLLALSKEGVKAIQIVNQECSSVTTPSSSITNVRENMNRENNIKENKISLQEIFRMLIQLSNKKLNKERTEKNNIQNENLYNTSFRNLKKKKLHKIKCINISKSHLKKGSTVINPAVDSTKNLQESFPNRFILGNDRKNNDLALNNLADIKHFSNHNLRIRKNTPSYYKIYKSNKIVINTSNSSSDVGIVKSPVTNTNKQMHRDLSSASIQSGHNIDNDILFMKLTRDKLKNIEKIDSLTKKCTQRLSNLAKKLEEVRRNKSTAYSQISTSDHSESDKKSEKLEASSIDKSVDIVDLEPPNLEPLKEKNKVTNKVEHTATKKDNQNTSSSEFFPLLSGIPKPSETSNVQTGDQNRNIITEQIKIKGKPPPALTRIYLKNIRDVVPHELSTVIEVDSPMSTRLKNTASHIKSSFSNISMPIEDKLNTAEPFTSQGLRNEDSSEVKVHDVSKINNPQLIDLQNFNDIMLEPFISINEFAKLYNIVTLDEGSNIEDAQKDVKKIGDYSSANSDNSLPDVVAELLKRNLITEPFKFDTISDTNTTSNSSDSVASLTASALSRTKIAKGHNKENIGESSDSLSISSNPDLENAFKKLGLGWASSTLKKTKERLALSSSSNSSTSSLSQLKLKLINKQTNAEFVTESASSIRNISKKTQFTMDISKNVDQNSVSNTMSVKEFLTNKLAHKITFTNKTDINEIDGEFISLYETKMPDEFKDHSIESHHSSVNRARTSTPVQIFKSSVFKSSSSNASNGLFSNVDEISSVKMTSNSLKNHSTSERDDLTIPNCSLRTKKISESSKSD